jgi:predicted phage-related endonuclease
MTKKQENQLKPKLERYIELQRQKNILDDELKVIKGLIIEKMDGAERLLIDGIKVENITVLGTRFDVARFKVEQEAMYNSYLSGSQSTRFSIR